VLRDVSWVLVPVQGELLEKNDALVFYRPEACGERFGDSRLNVETSLGGLDSCPVCC
jgi:hypothetical protein